MSARYKSFWGTGEPFIWLTGGALTFALLLFFMTFVLNTAAELIRLKLRRKYRYL